MQIGRLGAWYSTDKLGGPQQIKQFVATVERLGYDMLWYPESRGFELLSVAGFMLAQHHEAEARQLDRQHLRARCVHLPPRHADAARAVWRALHPRPRRQPSADGGRPARPSLRKADAGDARLSRRHLQGRGRLGGLADRASPRSVR